MNDSENANARGAPQGLGDDPHSSTLAIGQNPSQEPVSRPTMDLPAGANSRLGLAVSIHVLWFKRDLRLHNHAALHQAAAHGPVLALRVIEPSLWAQPDGARQHYGFMLESLREVALIVRSTKTIT